MLAVFAALTWWPERAERALAGLEEPERALALVVGRTLDLDDALEGAPAWERRLQALLSGTRRDDPVAALRWHQELAAVSDDPRVQVHLAILEGEARRRERWRRRTCVAGAACAVGV